MKFWNKTKQTATVEESVPSSHKATLGDDDATVNEWLELQYAVGINSAATGLTELKRFCRDELIQVYNTQEVFDYLSKEAKKSKTKWDAYPLRQVDQDWMKKDSIHAAVTKWTLDVYENSDAIYRNTVPIPALLTIQKFQRKFADEVNFYILALSQGDPFLAVTMRGCGILIVERWDEPGFRGKK